MKRFVTTLVVIFGSALVAWAATPGPLTTLRAIHDLTNAEASHKLPVAFEATVVYYRINQNLLFVQDDGIGIYVEDKTQINLTPGDRVLIQGTTRGSFLPFVIDEKATLLHHGNLPKAVPATFDELMQAKHDSIRVSIRGRVRTADQASTPHVITLQLLTDGGYVEVAVDSDDVNSLKQLLDAEIEVSGAAGGKFDGKMHQTGIVVYATGLADIKVLKPPSASPWSLPVVPMNSILTGYHVNTATQRVRVQGAITYYQPGSAMVLQNGTQSLWIMTQARIPLRIGGWVDATGIPDVQNGSLTLTHGEISESQAIAPVNPLPVTWRQLAANGNIPVGHQYDLVSIEGQVMMQVPESSQDEYVLVADGHLFSAVYRHPEVPAGGAVPPMNRVPLGSRIRVTGICMIEGGNSFIGQVPFNLLLRSPDDVVIIANPSLLNIRNLILVVSLLVVTLIAIVLRGWRLERKVRCQTAELAARIESEAALERKRSHILEDINGSRPLTEILEQIVELASVGFGGAACWCQTSDGANLGKRPIDTESFRVIHEDIPARTGGVLGVLSAALPTDSPFARNKSDALSLGAQLASIAIETRRIYADLLHRSEFDLLTDIHNRFSLEKHFEIHARRARETNGIFGLIYIDLDRFKQVNDVYGHRVGDSYLQNAAIRMQRQLRGDDLLARLGGDEFAALVPGVRTRAEVEEIARRLEQCFDDPFHVGGYMLTGSASIGIAIYPQDGATRDSLLNAADAGMYVAKYSKRQQAEASGDTSAAKSDQLPVQSSMAESRR
jgi:diguanylate cyclase (GGDEF)-like protein